MPSLSGMTTMLTPFHRYAASGVAFHKRRLEAPVDPFMVQVSLVSKDSTCMANEFKGYPNFRAKRRHHTRRKGTTLLLPSTDSPFSRTSYPAHRQGSFSKDLKVLTYRWLTSRSWLMANLTLAVWIAYSTT